MMQELTPEGLRIVEKLAQAHSVSTEAVMILLRALAAGGGTQARLEAEEREREAASILEAKQREIEAQQAVEAKALLEVQQKAERDARYAARKGRKAQAKSEERRYR
jgi:hypothetical protein